MDEIRSLRSIERAEAPPVPFAEAFRVWLRIGLTSFGGPAGQIAMMHRIVVDEKRWIGEERFLHALNYCMLLPGPEAQQLATYVGWLLHRTLGGIVAGTLFVLPGLAVILALSVLYAGFQEITAVKAVFFGIKAAVLAVVVEAVIRIGRRALKNAVMIGIAAAAFVGIFFLDVAFPLIIAAAGLIGLAGGRFRPGVFVVIREKEAAGATVGVIDAALSDGRLPHTVPDLGRIGRVAIACLVLWLGPVAVFAIILGAGNVFVQEGVFFSKMAVVTFGGAYAVLAYVAQQAVAVHGWLAPGEMLDGLGLAETTPGPLILVLTFVGFLGAYRAPGALDPMLAGTLGALFTTWVTFAPSFLWIFVGGPFVESLRGNRLLGAALSAITAAVVGVVLNLAVWFAVNVVFHEVDTLHFGPVKLLAPAWGSLDGASLALAVAALVAMLRFHVGMIPTLAAAAALGAAWYLAALA